MRIAHVLLSLNADYGGPAASAPAMASAQAGLGHRVTLVVPDRPSLDDDIHATRGRLNLTPAVSVRPYRLRPADLASLAGIMTPAMTSVLAGHNMVHIHDLWHPYLAAAAAAARASGIPYIITPHGTLNSWSLAQKKLKKRIAWLALWQRIANDAHCLHALNASEREQISLLRLNTPVVIAPNGGFLGGLPLLPEQGQFRHRHHIPLTAPLILFLGRLHANKGIDVLINAFREVAARQPDAHLVIAGPDEGVESALRSQILAHPAATQIHMVGPLYGEDKLSALNDCDIFCLPSRGEAFSMAVVEAMSTGTAVVLSRHCNFPEVATEGAGLITELTACDLAHALVQLTASPERRQDCADAATRMVAEHYTWEQVARRLLTFYGASRLDLARA